MALALPAGHCVADSITLALFAPEHGGCGDVAVNGYVFTSEGTIERMQWEWGDGTTNDSWFPALHRYPTNGNYQIRVTADSSPAETRTETVNVDVTNANETGCSFITFFLNDPDYLEEGAISISGSVGTSVGKVECLVWDWGDGNTDESWLPVTHAYASNGDYLILVTAYATEGLPRTKSVTAIITNAPAAECYITLSLWDPDYLGDGAISVNGSVATDVGTVERLVWSWGDGSTNESWFPALHTYSSNGSYPVFVTAYGTEGLPRTESVTAVVTNAADTNASVITLSLFDPNLLSCGEVWINGVVVASVGVVERLDWDWGDGTISQSFFPAQHTYMTNGSYTITVTAHGTEGPPQTETQTAAVDTLEPACANTFRVYPDMVFLKNGKTNQALTIDLRTPDGWPIPAAPASASYQCDRPDLVQVTADGMVSGAGLGSAVIMVSVPGQPRQAKVVVVAGEIRVEPTILLLSMDTPTNGQVRLEARNADGSLVDLTGRSVVFSGGNDVASVDAHGLVTPLRPPRFFNESPYISATLDLTPPCNSCVVRVTQTNLNLAMRDYVGEFITVRVPGQLGSYSFETLMTNLQVGTVLDALFRMERRFCGTRPCVGGQQYYVLDPGVDADGTVPCAVSGNPIRVGVGVDNLRSCFGGEDWIHWGVLGHELGHNFLYQASFMDFVNGLSNGFAYSEGLASAVGAFSVQELINHPQRHGLSSNTIASLNGLHLALSPDNIRHDHYGVLTNYEANPDYAADFTPDHVDAILFKLGDQYGPNFFFRLMSVFYPPEEVFLGYRNETQRLTFWVAACSAAARADLRARFRDTWGYPIDDAFYEAILPQIEQRASQRDPLIKDWFVITNQFHLTAHAIPDTAYQLECSSNLVDWVGVKTNTAVTFTTEWAETMEAARQCQFFRVRQIQ